jgi:hypothetical protein
MDKHQQIGLIQRESTLQYLTVLCKRTLFGLSVTLSLRTVNILLHLFEWCRNLRLLLGVKGIVHRAVFILHLSWTL